MSARPRSVTLLAVLIAQACLVAAAYAGECSSNGMPDQCESVIYVNAAAGGANDGTSWADAFTDLQSALAAAGASGQAVQLWIAAGSYAPAGPGGDRTATFQLLDGVGLYGGFTGSEEAFDQRDPAVHATVLSGDLNGDDPTSGRTENSHHVVTASGTGATAVLDGVVITAGNANGSFPHDRGAGLFSTTGHATIRQSALVDNTAIYGAVYLADGGPTFTACRFESNAGYLGGAVLSDLNARPLFTDCRFQGNTADAGAGLFSSGYGAPVLVNCVFAGNAAAFDGAAAYVTYSAPTFTNCTFAENAALRNGGGLLVAVNATPVLRNSILWGNQDVGGRDASAQVHVVSGSAELNYCCIQGGWAAGGTGNLEADPRFVRHPDGGSGGWGSGGDDDYGDLRLLPESPCIDAADNDADTDPSAPGVQPLPPTDLNGAPRFVDDPRVPDTGSGSPPVVDLGAHEYQADCNVNGVRDDADISGGTSTDCDGNGLPDECDPDCDSNGTPDACDLIAGLADDCNTNLVPDSCDLASGASPDCNTNGTPDECDPDANSNGVADDCEIAGDFNGDGRVDAADHAGLVECLSGPAQGADYVAPPSWCLDVFDDDADGDVDLADFAAFARAVQP